MIVSKKAIPRRTVLRGMGVTLALPLLDSMIPALAPLAKAAALPKIPRFVSTLMWTARARAEDNPQVAPCKGGDDALRRFRLV